MSYSPEQQAILDEVRERRGDDFVDANADLILAQARLVGEIGTGEDGRDMEHGEDDRTNPFEGTPATYTEGEEAFHAMYVDVLWDEQADGKHLYASERMPESVRERVIAALQDGAIFPAFETMNQAARSDMREWLLNQARGEGWTMRSLADRLRRIDPTLTQYEAERIARTETQSIVTYAREKWYSEEGDFVSEDTRFIWQGPQDHRTTEACEWLKGKTNPRYRGAGGADYEGPVTLERMRELVEEASKKFFPDLDLRRWTVHPHERHTIVRYYDLT